MLRDLKSSVIGLVVLTLVLGLGLPALMTGFAQGAFPNKANGSLIKVNGKVIGSRLAAQSFTKRKYFHERPSATSPPYNAAATTFANLGPTNPELAKNVRAQVAAIMKLEAPYNPGPHRARHPGRRGHDIRLRDRSRHLTRVRRTAGSPGSRRPSPAAFEGAAADQEQHRRAQPRLPR